MRRYDVEAYAVSLPRRGILRFQLIHVQRHASVAVDATLRLILSIPADARRMLARKPVAFLAKKSARHRRVAKVLGC